MEDIFKGTYSLFRQTQRLSGFSPLVAYMLSMSDFIQKIYTYTEKNGNVYWIDKLIHCLMTKAGEDVVITKSNRSPIYVMATMELLPQFIYACSQDDPKYIDTFFSVYRERIIEESGRLQYQEVNTECGKREKESCTSSRCKWDGVCKAREKSSSLTTNKRLFQTDMTNFVEIIKGCHIESHLSIHETEVPFFLFGMVLGYYWWSIKNETSTDEKSVSDSEKIKEYVDMFESDLVSTSRHSFFDIEQELLKFIGGTLPQLHTITVKWKEFKYPNCVEIMINDFFNVLLFDPEIIQFNLSLFPTDFMINPRLISFYTDLNSQLKANRNMLIVDSKKVKEDFTFLTVEIPGIKYYRRDCEVFSDEENVISVISYLTGHKFNNFKDFESFSTDRLKVTNVGNEFKLLLDQKIRRNITLNIQPGHSYSTRKNPKELSFIQDNISYICSCMIYQLPRFAELENFHPVVHLGAFNFNFLKISMDKSEELYYTEVPVTFIKLTDDKILTFDRFYPKSVKILLNIGCESLLDFSELTNLVELNFSSIKMVKIPESILKLSTLQKLDVSFCDITDTTGIESLSNLKYLDIHDNPLKNFVQIFNLLNLEHLHLYCCKIKELPYRVERLVNLRTLNLMKCGLQYIPSEIGKLQHLERLNISNNPEIKDLPSEICDLTELRYLYMSDCGLKIIPSEIGNLHEVLEIISSRNAITGICPEIGKLTKLQILDLSDNIITIVPNEIGQLVDLRELELSSNRGLFLPSDIVKLQKLVKLCLNYCIHIVVPPFSEGSCPKLEELHMVSDNLTDVPLGIEFLRNLSVLDMSVNKLTKIPPELGMLTKLKHLYLTGNKLTEIPPAVEVFHDLESLFLPSNLIKNIPPWLFNLDNLIFVSLVSNLIEDIPIWISKVKRYFVLYLSGNPLNPTPPEISSMIGNKIHR